MKRTFLQFAMIGAVLSAGAQTLEEARKDIDNENFFRAKNSLRKLLADPAVDHNQAAYYLGNAYLKTDDPDSAKIFYAMLGENNKTAYGSLALGRIALINKKNADAKGLLDKAAITSKMKNSEILYQIGDAWFKPTTTDLKEAIYYFEEAYKLDLKNSTNMLALGDAYLENNEGGKAMSKYESAAEVNTKLTMAFVKIGRLNVRARTYDDAIVAYKKALALEPDNALAHKELGEAYYLSKKYDLAKPEFKRYIELNKDDADAKTRFISFLFQSKEYEQVATEAAQMLQDDPNNYILLRSLSFSNFELKRYKDGYEFAKRFWANSNGKKVKPIDYVYSARLAALNGDTVQAINYFKTALETEKDNADLSAEYAKTLWQSKRYTDAIVQYNAKIAQFGGGALDYYYLGRSYFSAGNYVAADSTFATFVTKQPTSPDGYVWRAKCNSRIDPEMKAGSAFPFYQKFIELAQADVTKNKRNLVEAYGYMGAYYMNAKDNTQAKQNFEKALELDPNDELAKELLKGLK